MKKWLKSTISCFITLTILLLSCVPSWAVTQNDVRLYGSNRYDTAIKIAGQMLSDGSIKSLSGVVIATGNDFPDALSGSVFAKKMNMPILLASDSTADFQNTLNFIKQKLTSDKPIYVLGGIGAVKTNIIDALKQSGYNNIHRIAGNDRYDTCGQIFQNIGAAQSAPVFIATGNDFPDALSASSVAAINQYPILLVEKNSIPDKIKSILTSLKPSRIYIVGGTGVISDNVKNTLEEICGLNDSSTKRLSGNNRYETSKSIAEYFNLSGSAVSVATGMDFPDALTGSIYAAYNNSSIVLADNYNSQCAKTFIDEKGYNKKVIFGGPGAVSYQVENYIISGIPVVNPTDPSQYSTFINFSDTKEYKIVYNVTLSAHQSSNVDLNLNLGTLSQSPYQKEMGLTVSGSGANIVTNSDGTKNLIIRTYLSSGQTASYQVIRTVQNSCFNYKVDISKTSGDYSKFAGYTKYTSPEDKIESNNSAIIAKSKQILSGITNPYEKAKKVYEFVNSYMTYDYNYGNKGALSALQTARGVCEDYSELFVALLRASGVPARVAVGYWIDNSQGTIDGDSYRHAWPEFYLPEYGWVMAEPTNTYYYNGQKTVNFSYFAQQFEGEGYHVLEGYNIDTMSMGWSSYGVDASKSTTINIIN